MSKLGHAGWRSPVVVNHHPLVSEFNRLQVERDISDRLISKLCGIARTVPHRWRGGNMPTIGNFDAALNVLGYRLTIVPIDEGKEP